MRVLIVGSAPNLVASLKACFTVAGYDVLTADNAVAALGMVLGENPNLVIQELDERGSDCCWQIRSVSNVPLLALCAGSEGDRITALYRGADICLAISFDYDLLLAHSQALLRWSGHQAIPGQREMDSGVSIRRSP